MRPTKAHLSWRNAQGRASSLTGLKIGADGLVQLPTNKGANGRRFIVSVLLAFGGCQRKVNSRQRRAGQGQKESGQTLCQPLAPRSTGAMFSPRGLPYRPLVFWLSIRRQHSRHWPESSIKSSQANAGGGMLFLARSAQAGASHPVAILRLATGRRQPRDGRAPP